MPYLQPPPIPAPHIFPLSPACGSRLSLPPCVKRERAQLCNDVSRGLQLRIMIAGGPQKPLGDHFVSVLNCSRSHASRARAEYQTLREIQLLADVLGAVQAA